jgi:hypothetical protein
MTITIDERLLKDVQKLSGKLGYSDAITASLEEYMALRKRPALLEDLRNAKPPHALRR